MAGGKTSPKTLTIAAREARAVELRLEGCSFRVIAETLSEEFNQPGYNESQAYGDVKNSLKKNQEEHRFNTNELRDVELQRYDDWLSKIMPKVKAGDVKAISTALMISQQRSRLLGLEMPVEIKVTEMVDSELAQLLSTLQVHLPGQTYKEVLRAIAGSSSGLEAARRN